MTRPFALSLLALSLSICGLAACSGGEAVPDARPVEAPVAEEPEPIVTCYVGTTTVTGPDGEVLVDGAPTVLWRTLEPGKDRIVEKVVNFDGTRLEESQIELAVEGEQFTGTGVDYTVSGELVGEPWAWKEWSSTSTFPDGSRVVSREHLEGEVLHAEKTFHNAGEVEQVTAVEELTEMTVEQCQAAVADLRQRPVDLS